MEKVKFVQNPQTGSYLYTGDIPIVLAAASYQTVFKQEGSKKMLDRLKLVGNAEIALAKMLLRKAVGPAPNCDPNTILVVSKEECCNHDLRIDSAILFEGKWVLTATYAAPADV